MTSTAQDESATTPWTIERVLQWASGDLRSRGSSSPRLDAELLLGHVLDSDRVHLIIDGRRPLSPDELAAYRGLHQRRRRGEPVAYLVGRREFYGRSFCVDPRVLIPRPDTEILVEVALRRTRPLHLCAQVLDLCTGSGCVGITLAKERPTTMVTASDLSADALEVAQHNAVALGAQLRLVHSDRFAALEALRGQLDLITANPPYIPEGEMAELPIDVRQFEPRAALAAGPDGLSELAPIIRESRGMLAPGGVLAVEVAAGQAPAVRDLFEESRFAHIETTRDYAGHERVVSGAWHAEPPAP